MSQPKRSLWWALIVWSMGILIAGDAGGQGRFDLDAPIVINEILASNRSAVTDPQRDYDDWVELYNPNQVAVDVGGMYLTDDAALLAKWQFPIGVPETTTIAPRGYLLIWADGDVTSAGLHANFKLNADGEQLSLMAADAATVIDSIEFGPQIIDVSYGRYPDGDPNLRYMAEPTPGATNSDVYEGLAEEPQFSVRGCLCREPVTVTLSTATPDATIYYTLDGREPFSTQRNRPGGFTYSGPLRVTRTTTIKAVTWRPGWRHSRIHTERYTFIDADLQDFSSPLPIAVIDTLATSVSNAQVPTYSYFIDTGRGGRATITDEVDFSGYAGLNVRGQSSSGFPKRPYHFETWDEDDRDQAASILGFSADADWVLHGPYSDKSLMRNVLAYRWSNEIGQYAPRTRLIELFLNTGSSTVSMDDYIGVYVFMEKIKIAPGRVDIAELDSSDNAESEITGGYIIKKDKTSSGDVTFYTNRGHPLIYDDPDGRDLTVAQKEWIKSYVNAFETALYGANFTDALEGYAPFIDAQSFVDHHIIVELCKNIDGFRISTFMYKDRNGKLKMGPVWDYNLSLGNADYLEGWIPTGWYNELLGSGAYPWWDRLFEDPQFRLLYADRWFAMRRDVFTTDRLLGMIDDYASLLEEPQARNFNRWRILGRYIWPNWYIARTYQEEIDWMKGWLADRLTWMDGAVAGEFAAVPPTFSRQGGQVDWGCVLEMATASGTVYYTLDGSDPRSMDPATASVRNTVLAAEDAAKRVLVPTGPVDDAWQGGAAFDDSAWMLATGGPGGVGYEASVGYEDFITLDLGARMYGQQSSCYLRIPFGLTERPWQYDSVTLRVRYDDGFIAYLNGVEVARRNVVGTPSWNGRADHLHSDVDAVDPEVIEIANFSEILGRGENILALHGLNTSSTSSDLLISAELIGTVINRDDIVTDVNEYDGPIVLSHSMQVKARALIGTTWSALNEATFAVGPVAQSLRISELMYHPVDTGHPDDPNTEYVELVNVGAETVDLNLIRFTDGIEFVFPSVELVPGECVLVVKDLAAFEAKYGPGLPVVGQYTGSLSNSGERLELQDAAGAIIHDFAYQDDWYDVTDGDGFSLTVADPMNAPVETWSDPAAWRPSFDVGGSPGSSDPTLGI